MFKKGLNMSYENGEMGPAFAGYPSSVDDIDQMMHDLTRARQQMIHDGTQKPMDAKDEQLVNLAHEAGEMKALYRTERERRERAVKQLDKIAAEDYDGQIVDLKQSHDIWRERAEIAEEKLAKKRKRK